MSPLTILLVLALGALIIWVFRLKRQVWAADYHVRLRDHERETVFAFLNELGSRITKRPELDESLELVVDFCCRATRADAGAIFLRDPDQPEMLQARVVQGLFPPLHEVTSEKLVSRRKYLADYVRKERIRINEGIIGFVASSGEALLIPDASADPRVPRSANELVPLDDLMLAPLRVRNDVQGVLVLINKRQDGVRRDAFNSQDLELVRALAEQASVTVDLVRLYEQMAEKQRLEQELNVAHEFQALLLPRRIPEVPEVDIYGYSQPALEVGGDYFDYIEIDEDHLGIVVGDVSGKGIPGALVMATLRSTLRAEALRSTSPREVLRHVNTLLTRDTKESVFVSATYGVLNLRTGIFTFARAGHEPLICCAPGSKVVSHYEPNGMVLGMIEGEVFDLLEEGVVDLKAAGTVVLYTDGVPEAMNGHSEEYGVGRFEHRLLEVVGESPQEVVDSVLEDIRGFTSGIPQHDDITLVVLRWKGDSVAQVELAGHQAASSAGR